MRLKIHDRKDGTVRVEVILSCDYDYADCIHVADPDDGSREDIAVGSEGCLVYKEDVRTREITDVFLWADKRGFPGNLNSAVKDRNGWRGTHNDVAVYAKGWRRVESISRRKRGLGINVILSEELITV